MYFCTYWHIFRKYVGVIEKNQLHSNYHEIRRVTDSDKSPLYKYFSEQFIREHTRHRRSAWSQIFPRNPMDRPQPFTTITTTTNHATDNNSLRGWVRHTSEVEYLEYRERSAQQPPLLRPWCNQFSLGRRAGAPPPGLRPRPLADVGV